MNYWSLTSTRITYWTYKLEEFYRSWVQKVITIFILRKTLHNRIKQLSFHYITIVEFVLEADDTTTTAQCTLK